MPDSVDPVGLEGEDLDRWYRRSPQQIDDERNAADTQRYQDFFGASDTGSDLSEPSPGARSSDPSFVPVVPERDINPSLTWVPAGPNRWRGEPISDQPQATPTGHLGSTSYLDTYLDKSGAGASDGAYLLPVGNPHNPRLRGEWADANGRPWPKTDDGRNYDVAHRRAIADGGSNTLDNIEPMHPDAHRAQHIENGDAARWGRRSSIARTFGGKVEPPTPRSRVNGLGIFGLIPGITGILSGRIRTDTPMHTLYDLAGFPAPDDYPPESA